MCENNMLKSVDLFSQYIYWLRIAFVCILQGNSVFAVDYFRWIKIGTYCTHKLCMFSMEVQKDNQDITYIPQKIDQ